MNPTQKLKNLKFFSDQQRDAILLYRNLIIFCRIAGAQILQPKNRFKHEKQRNLVSKI